VKWRCAFVFATAGTAGATVGSTFGKQFDGERLLTLFGALMIVIAALMFVKNGKAGNPNVRLTRASAPYLMPLLLTYGIGIGALAGFFGIGGGFLVVPGIVAATGMPLIFAIGSSLVSVCAFGLTTAANYALSGLIEWLLVAYFIGGGIIGGIGGQILAQKLSERKQALSAIFSGIVALVGIYIVIRGWSS
jgi:uncharacterized membrane protein YfcA